MNFTVKGSKTTWFSVIENKKTLEQRNQISKRFFVHISGSFFIDTYRSSFYKFNMNENELMKENLKNVLPEKE